MTRPSGYCVLFDKTGTFTRHSVFSWYDFLQTLSMGMWPQHLMVRDLGTQKCYQVNAMELEEIEDRNWFEYRKEQVTGKTNGKNTAD